MPKSTTVNEVLKRVEVLERFLKVKDDEITSLKSSVRDAEKFFTDELHKRDIIITDLYSKIYDLHSKLTQKAIV